ncbi:hypothetical protein V2H45_18190 [Tumidithrix elongata RA019]|uniref:Uncharacterized protein n=1 Tax=Tumidithrix elongata BACA0141 TaxID=2716417 RepID=A0AAW9Q5G4_9CYAN|nr:hypothetical protein [Tumidithrix elongata RA019]
MTNREIEESLLNTLNAYVRHFDIPNSREDLLAIASSILTFQQKQGILKAIAPEQVDALIQQVVNQFEPTNITTFLVDSATDTLVQQVNAWRESLGNQVLNSLNAYVQKFQPDKTLDLTETIASIIPLIENIQLHQVEAKSLIQRVKSQFNWQNALEQAIGAGPLAIAEKLAKLLQFGNLEGLLKETVLANLSGLDRTLETVTESLVNTELSKILGNHALQFDLDLNTDLESRQLLVKQVTLKLNLMQRSPLPSKSVQEIANQVDSEIERLKAGRPKEFEIFNQPKPPILRDLNVDISKPKGDLN